ncbi:hypothetical protein C8Q78DRAFT_1067674 [Trametes maxima]|nr:hypothetical protein C8Q78DRAFT_1067674 [Trametes maxima]
MARRPSSGSIGLPGSPEINRPNGIATIGTPKRNSSQPAVSSQRPTGTRTTSSTQKLGNALNLNDIDPDELFTKYSVPEIKMVQHRLRSDADAKQEELRLMVGERYRDLLQASTSILALAKSSQQVLHALDEMRETVGSVNPSRAPRRTVSGEDKHLQALQSLSAHVKLLLDAPEHLWRLMERKSYLNATWLFLLARVVHRALTQDDDDQSWHAYGIDVSEHLPLVQRQWDTITPFRSQISHRATLFLREPSSMPGEVCATLLTLHLLESRPIPETLSIYLAQRTKTLSALLARSASASNTRVAGTEVDGRSLHRPRKALVREAKQSAEAALGTISQTVITARRIFADSASGEPSTMKRALQFFQSPLDVTNHLPPELQLSTQILLSTLPSSNHFLLLPQNIRAYKPYVDNASLTSPHLQDLLRDKLHGWLNRAIHDLNGALVDWFTHLGYVRDVWDVRSALLQQLKDMGGLEPFERQELESVIDAASLKQATSVWKAALGRLQSSFREAILFATTALTEQASAHPLDTKPVEHLFQAPSIPSGLQSGAHSAASAAVQFSKYRSSLQQQLGGRTPLVDSALTVLEHHAAEIQEDLAAMQKSLDNKNPLILKMSTAYQADAEAASDSICSALEGVARQEESALKVLVYVRRISQELSSPSGFFIRIGCGEAAAKGFRQQVSSLAANLTERWQQQTVSQVIEASFKACQPPQLPLPGTVLPSRPSPYLTETILFLSSELQRLGVCLDGECRQQLVRTTLVKFIIAFVNRSERDARPQRTHTAQLLWDFSLLRQLAQLWGIGVEDVIQRIDASTARLADSPPESDIDTSAEEYLTKTQVLLAPLLPTYRPTTSETKKGDKQSTLLLFGPPAAEHGFESALQLVKTPPRFGLLLVGGAALR